MRRLARHLSTLCPAASLVLFVAVCALWVRSYRLNECVIHSAGQHGFSAYSDRGEMGFRRQPWRGESVYRRYLKRDATPGNRLTPPYSKSRWPGGFWFESESRPVPPGSHAVIVVPHWAMAFLLLIPPATVAARRSRAFLRRRRHRCATCGYDLRAGPERCPECGTATAGAAAAAASRSSGLVTAVAGRFITCV